MEDGQIYNNNNKIQDGDKYKNKIEIQQEKIKDGYINKKDYRKTK